MQFWYQWRKLCSKDRHPKVRKIFRKEQIQIQTYLVTWQLKKLCLTNSELVLHKAHLFGPTQPLSRRLSHVFKQFPKDCSINTFYFCGFMSAPHISIPLSRNMLMQSSSGQAYNISVQSSSSFSTFVEKLLTSWSS